jgi:hypothetical protein
MGINIGAGPVDDIRIGTAEVDKVYRGDTQIWSAETGPAVIVDQLTYSPTNTGTGIHSYTFDLTTLNIQAGDVAVLFTCSGTVTTGNQVNTATDSESVLWDRLNSEQINTNRVVNSLYVTVFGATLPDSVTTTIINSNGGNGYYAMRASIYIIRNAIRPTVGDFSNNTGLNSPGFARDAVDTDVLLGGSGNILSGSASRYNQAPNPLGNRQGGDSIVGFVYWCAVGTAEAVGLSGDVGAGTWLMNSGSTSARSFSLIVPKKP